MKNVDEVDIEFFFLKDKNIKVVVGDLVKFDYMFYEEGLLGIVREIVSVEKKENVISFSDYVINVHCFKYNEIYQVIPALDKLEVISSVKS